MYVHTCTLHTHTLHTAIHTVHVPTHIHTYMHEWKEEGGEHMHLLTTFVGSTLDRPSIPSCTSWPSSITLKDMKPHPYFSYKINNLSSYQTLNVELELVRIRHVLLTMCLLILLLSCRVGQGGSPQKLILPLGRRWIKAAV